jgi:hypothetical protein
MDSFFLDLSPSPITISINRNRQPWFSLQINPYSTVSSLKSLISTKSGLYPSQQRLIFRGTILLNEMSLSYYNITNGSELYFVPIPPPSQPRARPYHLLNKLWSLLDQLSSANSHRYLDIVSEIKQIIENPVIQSLSRIDAAVKDAIDDAWSLIETTQRPISAKSQTLRARGEDQLLDQFDNSPEGIRILQAALDEISDREIGPLPEPTKVRYSARISEKPLPNPWAMKRRDGAIYSSGFRLSFGEFEGSARMKFSKEVAVLKDMGFNDEDRIVKALCQTNGNVRLAAQLLENPTNEMKVF